MAIELEYESHCFILFGAEAGGKRQKGWWRNASGAGSQMCIVRNKRERAWQMEGKLVREDSVVRSEIKKWKLISGGIGEIGEIEEARGLRAELGIPRSVIYARIRPL